MADIEEVYVQDLYKKHKGKEIFKGFYTVGKKTYRNDGQVINESLALDKETLEILRARIMAVLIDEYPVESKKPSNHVNAKESSQT